MLTHFIISVGGRDEAKTLQDISQQGRKEKLVIVDIKPVCFASCR